MQTSFVESFKALMDAFNEFYSKLSEVAGSIREWMEELIQNVTERNSRQRYRFHKIVSKSANKILAVARKRVYRCRNQI